MSKQSQAQREFIRDVRTKNSINYSARTTKPSCLQNVDIITKTMAYNELDANPNSPEAKRVKAVNTVLLVITIAFETTLLFVKALSFLCGGNKRRR